jgi:hypothetical protein
VTAGASGTCVTGAAPRSCKLLLESAEADLCRVDFIVLRTFSRHVPLEAGQWCYGRCEACSELSRPALSRAPRLRFVPETYMHWKLAATIEQNYTKLKTSYTVLLSFSQMFALF